MLNVSVETIDHRVIIHCEGGLVRGHETKLLCATLQQNAGQLVVDLSGVSLIDAAGIGALVSLQAAGYYLQLANPTNAVREVLTRTKLDSVFEIIRPKLIRELMPNAALEASVP